MDSDEDLCLRCGQCCYATRGSISRKCRYLKKDNTCAIYSVRLGATMGTIHNKNYYCVLRKNSDFDYKGCPYNTTKQLQKFPLENPLQKTNKE